MVKKNIIVFSMSLKEVLSMVASHIGKTELDSDATYTFHSWDNKIPGDLLDDKETVKLSFEKTA